MQTHFCITEIRKIIKFQPNFVMDVIERYSSAFVDLFNNGKTQIIKNLLRMVKEVFDLGQQFNVEKAVYAFLPIILKKSSTDLGHIKEMSQHVLISFSMNCGYDISFKSIFYPYLVAAGFCMDKNIPMAELSIKLLAKLIEKVGNQITQLNPDTLKDIMHALEVLIEGKRQTMQKQALDICMYIYNLLGSENYLYLMNFSLKPEEVNTMGTAMQSHRANKEKQQVSLAQVKKARKTEMHMAEQNQNFNMNMGMGGNMGGFNHNNMNMGNQNMNGNMNMGMNGNTGMGFHQGMR